MIKIKKIKLILFVFLIYLMIEILVSKYCLETTYYCLYDNDIKEQVRILQITDLHNSVFGKDNLRLISAIENQSPDIILITGDLIDSKTNNIEIAVCLVRELVKIAPVYISYGNQEKELEENSNLNFKSLYSLEGATVLDYDYVDLCIKGSDIRIGGLFGYCQPSFYAHESGRDNETFFLYDFQSTQNLKILLCHMPVCWKASDSLSEWDVEYVFSGHAHGGQICVPFLGALWAPDEGFFPGKEYGVFCTTEDSWKSSMKNLLEYAIDKKYDISRFDWGKEYEPSTLVLSRGLGNTDWIPRINNIPEIVVVDLVPKE